MKSLSTVFQIAGWLAVILILILSLVPGYARPHVLASGKLEHFAAYFLTAAVLALGYRGWSKAIGIALFLSAYSGILEILQLWIPGRTTKLTDFVISSFGAFVGILLVSLALWCATMDRR